MVKYILTNIKATKFNQTKSVSLMKYLYILLLLFCLKPASAQKIDSIFFNLYTDSLKKGSWNYINVDAKLSNGKYIPLSNKQLVITASDGKLEGNSIWLDWTFKAEKITIVAYLKDQPQIRHQHTIWVKKYDLQMDAPVQDSVLQKINQRPKKSITTRRKKN
jgi:hypothetical protein